MNPKPPEQVLVSGEHAGIIEGPIKVGRYTRWMAEDSSNGCLCSPTYGWTMPKYEAKRLIKESFWERKSTNPSGSN